MTLLKCPHCREDVILLHLLDIKEILERIEKAQRLPDWDLVDEVRWILRGMLSKKNDTEKVEK